MPRHAKRAYVLLQAGRCIDSGNYLDTMHATRRQSERAITRPEILQVLKRGYHEQRKDRFDELHGEWNYAVRGKTVDGRAIRIIISSEDSVLLIVAAMEWVPGSHRQ